MNEHFRTAPPDKNVVLQYVGAAHLLETRRGANIRVLSVWSKALESAGLVTPPPSHAPGCVTF